MYKGVENPKVSVCVVTYNHEKYIEKCLQSIVGQETDFDFEVIVGEDCSTDSTRAIVQRFVEEYPEIVRPIFHVENVGGTKNYLAVHAAARGDYIAHMDGDDYALPGKLQKQADFLDQNMNCSFVAHPVHLVSEDDNEILGMNPAGPQPTISDLNRLVRDYIFFAHSSKMYRRSVNIFDHSQDDAVIDFTVHIEHASQGGIGFLPSVLGCNRKHSGGITSGTGAKLHFLIDLTVSGFNRASQLGVHKEVVDRGKARYLIGAAFLCLARDDAEGYRRYLDLSRINGKFISPAHLVLFALKKQSGFMLLLFQIRQQLMKWIRKICHGLNLLKSKTVVIR